MYKSQLYYGWCDLRAGTGTSRERVLCTDEKRQNAHHFPGESGGSKESFPEIFKGEQRDPVYRLFFRIERYL